MSFVHEHQVPAIQPLVITPSPVKGESLLGFILRTAELNGYESPMKLLHYAGMDDNEARSVRPSLAKLAPLLGKKAEALKESGLDEASQSKGRYIEVMGHSIPSIFTRCKQASVCVECVKENGYIEGFHEIKYAVACPTHGTKNVHRCPACNQLLNWQRPGLAKCRCGADLTQYASDTVEDSAILVLLSVLRDKLMQTPLNLALLEDYGFPVEGLQDISVNTLLSVIYRFGLFNETSVSGNKEWDAVATTAKALSNWPYRFHEYLAEVHAPNANLESSGLRGQFNTFYESFFKNIANEDEVQFLREAFIQFGQQCWRKAIVHPKLQVQEPSETMGMQQLADQLGVQPSTLRKLIADGHVSVDCRTLNTTCKQLTLSPQQPFEFAQGKRLGLKEAAECLGIPVDVLRAYRRLGLYQAKHLVVPVKLFHERDVVSLREALMQDQEITVFEPEQYHVTLAGVMRMKMTAEMKALWLDTVRKREIMAFAKLTDKPSGLVFESDRVKSFFKSLRSKLQGTVSLSEASMELTIGIANLYQLVKLGLLHTHYLQAYGMRIKQSSIDRFSQRFIGCHDVANIKQMTQQSVYLLCHQLQIPILRLGDTVMSQASYWIPRAQAQLLGVNDSLDYSLVA